MANAYVLPSMVAAEALRVIHNSSAFLPRISKKYQKYFGRNGEMIGDTINIPTPPQYTIRSGPVANFQDANRTTVPLTIQPEIGIDLAIPDFDFTLKVDVDSFMDTYIRPAAQRLATAIDSSVATSIATQAGNTVGQPGTPPATTQAAQKLFLDAGVVLTNQGADPGLMDRMMVMSPSGMSNSVSQLNLGFNDQRTIGDQYKSGYLGMNTLGWNFFQSPNMPTLTTGTFAGTGVVNGANQGLMNTGATDNPNGRNTSLVTNGWTASSVVLRAGDVFTIAGVYAVNPDSKQLTYTSAGAQTLRQFTAQSTVTADGSGNATVVISPAIIAGGAFQNVTARPASGAAITAVGTANTTYPVSVGFVSDAITFASVPMAIPNGVDKASMMEVDGVSIRFVRDWDPYNNRRLNRLDVCFGVAVLRPEWAVRVYAG